MIRAGLMALSTATQLAMEQHPVLPHAQQRTKPGMKLQKDMTLLMMTLKFHSLRYDLTIDKSLTKNNCIDNEMAIFSS